MLDRRVAEEPSADVLASGLEIRNPQSLGAPRGLYSHVSVAPHARLAFIAGQLAVDHDGAIVGEGDIDRQIERCFRNVELALRALGVGWQQLAKMTTYVTSDEAIDDFYRVRAQLFDEFFPDGRYPPNTLLVVSRLVRPEFLVEIEGIAVV
jgi:enamine deaminase RidA (YjgF/YER057c/UK114 family)